MDKKIHSSWAEEIGYDDIVDELQELDGALGRAISNLNKRDMKRNKKLKRFPKEDSW